MFYLLMNLHSIIYLICNIELQMRQKSRILHFITQEIFMCVSSCLHSHGVSRMPMIVFLSFLLVYVMNFKLFLLI